MKEQVVPKLSEQLKNCEIRERNTDEIVNMVIQKEAASLKYRIL